MKIRSWATRIAILSLSLSVPIAAAADRLPVKTERVALFKNGMGVFEATVDVPVGEREVTIDLAAAPSLGTFWVDVPEAFGETRLVARQVTRDRRIPASDVASLIAANVGRRVRLVTADGVVEGTVRQAIRPPVAAPGSPSIQVGSGAALWLSPVAVDASPPDRAVSLILIETTGGDTVAMDPSLVDRVDFASGSIDTMETLPFPGSSLYVSRERTSEAGTMAVRYLGRGISWVPSYRVTLLPEGEAAFTAKALVVNEAIDLVDVDVELITGFPNLRYGEVESPISRRQSLQAFLQALEEIGSSVARSALHNMANQASFVGGDASLSSMGDPLAGAEGATGEDLFFYPVESLTVRRGETAYLPLFSTTMPYRHVYTWTIDDAFDDAGRYRGDHGGYGENAPEPEVVWHTIRLANTLAMPLTTAPITFHSADGRLVGQDRCRYTPPGAETTIRVNRALGLQAEQAEEELAREPSAVRIRGTRYDKVTVQGALRVRNRSARDVMLEVAKELSGEVLETSPTARDEVTTRGLKRANPSHRLTWALALPAGDEIEMRYRYEVLVRN